jgi:dolichyl-diphosphooligosaccharide--protein glycosyltransferase
MPPKHQQQPDAKPEAADVESAGPVSAELPKEKKIFGAVFVPPFVLKAAIWLLQTVGLVWAVWNAFRIRTYALKEYGFVIHEFDPWFNFRATQYLSKHTVWEFFHWYDYMSWYPLGRPVGTTIYPGLQFTAVAIHRLLRMLGKPFQMSLNNVCCYVPCWGGAACTFLMYLFTAEATGSRTAGVIAAIIMAVIPGHMMRSVGGGFDNESIAMTALMLTFYCWIRSLRTSASWPIGILTGLAYGYMVAAWGGYVFVLNMVALHAAAVTILDMLRNRYSSRVWKAYSLFYIIGNFIAVQIPVVGMTPFKSLEQLLALLVLIFLQVLQFSETLRRKADVEVLSWEAIRIRVKCFVACLAGLFCVAAMLWPTGYFGPLSSRVRGLFLQHTRTGNPLVDSVAEHQPATADAYWHYMHYCCYGWMIGVFTLPFVSKRYYAASFLVSYAVVTYYFSLRMARLIILASPVAAGMMGFVVGMVLDWCCRQLLWSEYEAAVEQKAAEGKDVKGKKVAVSNAYTMEAMLKNMRLFYSGARVVRLSIAVAVLAFFAYGKQWRDFNEHSENMARSFANPQLMFKSRLNNGREVMIDDYREAYFWLRDKTPKDSRVMAWWDYGYQITGIGERTSIADGNTWNHEHIATLGYCLTSPVKRAHELIRHLADYVLIWSGGGGDDLAKSPHMARIGNSVYRDICPKDPLCSKFGFRGQNHEDPTPMMRQSLLYNLHAHNMRSGVKVDPKLFKEAYTSKYGLVRIFKVMNVSEESKAWCADPANRKCDAPGSWYCEGQYPPAEPIQELLRRRMNFAQLEDFNKGNMDEEYRRQYMARMGGH